MAKTTSTGRNAAPAKPATRSPRKEPKRKEEILRAAAEVMRRKGVLATRLQDVADYLDVAYTALYHYFPSRDHLAEEVLCWSMEKRIELLERASGETQLERLLDFFSLMLHEGRQSQVRSPLKVGLPEPHHSKVLVARNQLRDRIRALIEAGLAEGSMRPCDPLTTANALLGLMERFAFLDRSLFSDAVRAMPLAEVVDQFCVILRDGILEGMDMPPHPSHRIENGAELLSFNRELTPELHRLDTILATATRHFNHEGINASIPRIAEDLGVSKTVVYQYVIDKQDLLFQCYLRGVSVVEMSHRIADDFGRDPLDKMLIHRRNLYIFHDSSSGPFTFLNANASLKPQHQRLIDIRNKGVRDTSIERMRQAQAAGTVKKDVIPDIAQPLFGQILYFLPAWYSDEYHLPIEEVCWQTGLLGFIGLRNR
ncbi:MAG: TetR/AcrR family transcriptional regulator [Pseudomonadota bacterium]